jgi:hypothetical protein
LRFETENGGGELTKGDCPIRRHLKVIVVVDGDDEEEDAHVYLIACAELLSGRNFNCLGGRQNWDILNTRSCGQLEV